MASFSVLSYNLWYGRALKHAQSLMHTHRPDVVCLQEFPLDPEAIGTMEADGYFMADYSTSFTQNKNHYGIATFYDSNTISHRNSEVMHLHRSIPELVLMLSPKTHNYRTVLATRLTHKSIKVGFDVYNLHLTFHGSNGIRLKQLKKVLAEVESTGNIPALIAGDFNYSYRRKILEKLIFSYGVCEASRDITWSLTAKVLGIWKVYLKPDYILYKGSQLTLLSSRRVEETESDHYPLIAVFSFRK